MIDKESKKITILTQSHLSRNPRVLKEALVLEEAGFQVSIITCCYDQLLYQEDLVILSNKNISYQFYIDLTHSNIKTYLARIVRKLSSMLTQIFRLQSVFSLGYSPYLLLIKARRQNADLYIVHQEMPSWVGMKLLKKGYKVCFDLEDWYSEDLLPEARKSRPNRLLKKIERVALANGHAVWTTSTAMSKALNQKYHSVRCPHVIYNSFPDTKTFLNLRQDRQNTSIPSLFWYSQTIGPGRGLEELMEALQLIDFPFELHLRGNVSDQFKKKLLTLFPQNNDQHLYFHSLVSNRELPGYIAQHDIGLALELKEPPSRNYTVTNKILQYLQAGLAVVASDTEGQKEIKAFVGKGVLLYKSGVTLSLAEQLSLLLADKDHLKLSRETARKNFQNKLRWNLQAEEILKIVNRV